MSRQSSTNAFQGFSVFQSSLGEALQWLPAVGTQELDDMINALLPGPNSIQDKRAHISMDFFAYATQTGETFKFYPVPVSAAAPSPASSAALYDSGYGSSFNVSPIVSDMNSWTQSPASFAPATSFKDAHASSSSRSSSKQASTSSSRQPTTDFATHPGMRIMTKDGRDVTNSASRGCKTKEQRDHAHLMRIIKACDACRRKKIRCDPTHKNRTASKRAAPQSSPQAEVKPAKKSKKTTEPPPIGFPGLSPDFAVGNAFESPETTSPFTLFEGSFPEDPEAFWDQFFLFDQDSNALDSQYTPDLHELLNNPQSLSPSSGSSSTSPSQVFTPYTPAPPGLSPTIASEIINLKASPQDSALPYLNPGVAHGTNYVDFNLYSPASDSSLDDELFAPRDVISVHSRHQSSQRNNAVINTASCNVLSQNYWTEVIPVVNSGGTLVSPQSLRHVGEQFSGIRHLDERYGPHVSLTSSPAATDQGGNLQTSQGARGPASSVISQQEDAARTQYNRQPTTSRTRLVLAPVINDIQASPTRSSVARSSQFAGGSLIHSQSAPSGFSSSIGAIGSNGGGGGGGRVVSYSQSNVHAIASAGALDDSPSGSVQTLDSGLASRYTRNSMPSIIQRSSPTLPQTIQQASPTQPRAIQQALSTRPRAISSVEINWQQPTWSRPQSQADADVRTTMALERPTPIASTCNGIPWSTAMNAALMAVIISTLPLRYNLTGEDAIDRSVRNVVSFSHFVVFGLVSFLLASFLPSQFPQGKIDIVDSVSLAITTFSLASLAVKQVGTGDLKPITSEGTSPSTGTNMAGIAVCSAVHNVKSKIQASGQRLQALRCAASRILRRARTFRSVRM